MRVRFVKAVFTYDWYNGTPADYPLITEVDPATGFVELTDFGKRPVPIGGWVLAAAGGQWPIPAGTVLVPGKPLVFARDLETFRDKYPAAPAPLLLPDLNLNAALDTLTLKRSATGATVDEVAWGGAKPGWELPGTNRSGLCRTGPGKDTNTQLDWADSEAGTPGTGRCGN